MLPACPACPGLRRIRENDCYLLLSMQKGKGVRSFLESRNINLPHGDPEEPPSYDTVCGLGNMKEDGL
jgi:hypothetical protein